MAVKIRLKRIGEKKVPMYRIVVAEASTPRNGRAIEEIGTYNPNRHRGSQEVDRQRRTAHYCCQEAVQAGRP